MINIKDYIGQSFIGKNIHLKCDCIMSIDIIGECVSYTINNDEIVLMIKSKDKIIPIGLNSPNLKINVL
jgi:hypothetical protein